MRVIYAGSRPFNTAAEAAQEVCRLSGEDAGVWQINRALLWNKGFVNGVPVFVRETEDAGTAEAVEEAAEPDKPPRRAPLIRIGEVYIGGIPPRWR
jgi:hypothetical protein